MNIAVILAGGKGLRLGKEIPKQMLQLGIKPVIAWSVDTFHKMNLIDGIIVVCEKNLITDIKKLFPSTDYPKILAFVEGGAERSDSSFNALVSSEFKPEDIFLFHDAARPFITEEIIVEVIHQVEISGACGTYIQTTDTIAIVENHTIKSIPERKLVYSAQTPQGFRYDLIYKAHQFQKCVKSINVTDDISLVLNMGLEVSVIMGSYKNLKITNDLDFSFAEFLISGEEKC